MTPATTDQSAATIEQLSQDFVLLLAEAAQDGKTSIPGIIEVIDATPGVLLSAPEQDIVSKMLALCNAGTPPTVPQMRRTLPHIPTTYWARRSNEASVQAVTAALASEHARKVLRDHLSSAEADLAAGEVDPATVSERLISAANGLVVGSNGLTDIGSFDISELSEEIPRIQTPFPAINTMLGGGLPVAGNGTFSLLIGHTGMGKTTLAYQLILKNLYDGGIGILYAGENGVRSVVEELARLDYCYQNGKSVTKGAWLSEKHRDTRVQAAIDLQQRTAKHLFVTEFFGSDSIIADITRLKGRLHRHYNILVVIDNIDHLQDTTLAGPRDQLHMILDRSARRLAQAAKRLGVHIMALAQADEKSKNERRAPAPTDIRKSTSMPHHAGVIMSIYRPGWEDRDAHDSIISIPKNRAGTSGFIKQPNAGTEDDLVNYGAGWWRGEGWK